MTKANSKILSAVFGYPNNHATATLDHLRRNHKDVKVQFYYWINFPAARKNLKEKIPEGAIKLSLANPIYFFCCLFKIIRSEHVYFQSFSTPRFRMAFLFWFTILFGHSKKILLASEGMKKTPSLLTRLFISHCLNSQKIIHLGIGSNSGHDFYKAGANKWSFRKYCFCEEYPFNANTKNRRDHRGQQPLKILSVGQLIPRKNFASLFEGLGILKKSCDFKLKLAGTGPLKDDLLDLAKSLRISESVELVGFCSHDVLHQLFLEADIFILNSTYDGWGVVVGHALNFGLPIIVSSGVRSGKGYLVEDGKNGFICDTPIDLAKRLLSCQQEEFLLNEMSNNSRTLANLWNIKTTSNRLSNLLEDYETQYTDGPFSSTQIHLSSADSKIRNLYGNHS